MTIVPMQTQQRTDVDLRCQVFAGLGTDDSKFDQILSVLKAKANPKASPMSNVGSAEADRILLGILPEDGNKAYPIVVPTEAPECSSFDSSQFSSEDHGTPRLLKHHQKQLTQFGVQAILGYMMFTPKEI